MRKSSPAGFTLLELMTAVAIAGVLSALAAQNYTQATAKAKRAEGRDLVYDIYRAQMVHFADANEYAWGPRDLPFPEDLSCQQNFSNGNVGDGKYSTGGILSCDLKYGHVYFWGVRLVHIWYLYVNTNLDEDPFTDLWAAGTYPDLGMTVGGGVQQMHDDVANATYALY